MRGREKLPRPAEVKRDVDDLIAAAQELVEDYNWAYGWSLSPTVAGDGGSTQIDQSDPTSGVVTSKAKAVTRATCREAAKALTTARNDIRQHRDRLGAQMGERGVPTMERGRFPKIVSKEELEASVEAQRRRRARGNHYGEG